MFVCKYGSGQLFVDPDAPETFDWLKKLSNEHKLFCLGCGKQVIFRKCVAKDSHFAHLSSEGRLCDFEQYIMALPDSHKRALKELQSKFADSNNPQMFEKLIEKHWTSMTICVENKIVAIELLQENASLNKIIKLKNAYAEKKIGALWMFVSDGTFCEYQSTHFSGVNQFLQKFGYTVCLDPENKNVFVRYIRGSKSSCNESNIFSTAVALNRLTVSTEGKIFDCVKDQYNEWKGQQCHRAVESEKQYPCYFQHSSFDPTLDMTRDEMLHNVEQWVNGVRLGAGPNLLNGIRLLIGRYPAYRRIYCKIIQNITDPILKRKLEFLLKKDT